MSETILSYYPTATVCLFPTNNNKYYWEGSTSTAISPTPASAESQCNKIGITLGAALVYSNSVL